MLKRCSSTRRKPDDLAGALFTTAEADFIKFFELCDFYPQTHQLDVARYKVTTNLAVSPMLHEFMIQSGILDVAEYTESQYFCVFLLSFELQKSIQETHAQEI